MRYTHRNISVGDTVLIMDEMGEGWNDIMERYCSCEVVVSNVDVGGFNIHQAEDDRTVRWTFAFSDIEQVVNGIATPSESGIKELSDKYPDMAILPEQVRLLAEDVFGGDRVSVRTDRNDNFTLSIHFPKLDMTNSLGEKHTITDLFVDFYVQLMPHNFGTDDYKADVSFYGCRRSISLKEYSSGYCHSHLPGGSYNSEEFCLGSSEFGALLSSLGEEMLVENWEMVLLSLENYLKWESIEGGPHVRMSSISYDDHFDRDALKKDAEKLMGGIPTECWEYRDGIKLIRAHPMLRSCLLGSSIVGNLDELCTKRRIRQREEAEGILNGGDYDSYMWGGEPIEMSVVLEEQKSGGESLSPEVLNTYCEIIEQSSSKFIKKYKHERAKEIYGGRVFGENRTIKQTNTRHHQRAETTD